MKFMLFLKHHQALWRGGQCQEEEKGKQNNFNIQSPIFSSTSLKDETASAFFGQHCNPAACESRSSGLVSGLPGLGRIGTPHLRIPIMLPSADCAVQRRRTVGGGQVSIHLSYVTDFSTHTLKSESCLATIVCLKRPGPSRETPPQKAGTSRTCSISAEANNPGTVTQGAVT